MKHIILTLVAVAGVAATSARADHVDIRGNINFGGPGYYAPGYVVPTDGYWRDVVTSVWIPPHWEFRHDYWNRPMQVWAPGHYEARTQRVWVQAYRRDRDRDRWEHRRERWDDERHDRDYRRDSDDRR